ncbi:MAG: type II toxin-antitoxin system VapC family toxin [Nevskiales bacterium]|nr:type II toxin-antitoxin system VapC family toxin [Nevskiales bacterium]
MNVLLDTNAYTALVRGERGLLRRLTHASRILMSAVVVGELEYGFRHGDRYAENRTVLDEFLAEPSVEFVIITRDTTLRYGLLMAELHRQGQKIPTNDAWIAGHALEHNAELWTRDTHFARVRGLVTSAWT